MFLFFPLFVVNIETRTDNFYNWGIASVQMSNLLCSLIEYIMAKSVMAYIIIMADVTKEMGLCRERTIFKIFVAVKKGLSKEP